MMKFTKYLLSGFIISIMWLIGFSCIAILMNGQKLIQFDQVLISSIQGLESPALTLVMNFFTFIGSFPSVFVISLFTALFLYFVLKHRIELILFVSVVISTPIINQILKHFFHRARPDFHRLIEIRGYSFPSGHAMNAFAVYGIITFLLWHRIPSHLGRMILILISSGLIIIIGASRIYLGVHYPSDIIGGYFASGFWLSCAIWFFQRYKEKQSQRKRLSD